MRYRIAVLFLCLGLTVMVLTVSAWAQAEVTHDSNQPVNITSNSLDVDDSTGVFVFRGDVIAQQDHTTIYSDRLDVYYTRIQPQNNEAETADESNRSIEKIIAQGAVRIVQNERIATGERAEYMYADNLVILTGSPTVVQGDNTIAGEKITVYLNDERSIIEGGEQKRVKAMFVPDERSNE